MRFIQISQTVLSQMPMPYHIESLEAALKKAGVLVRDVYVNEFNDKPNGASWGTGLFQIETDGRLTLIDSDWDSSD